MVLIGIVHTFVSLTALLFGKLNAHTVGSNRTQGPTSKLFDIGGGISLCNSARCSQNNTVDASGDAVCKCDDACPLYGDCCYSYRGSSSAVSFNFGKGPGEKDSVPMTCVLTRLAYLRDSLQSSRHPTASGYFMVTSCPHEYTNEDILEDCQAAGFDWLSPQRLGSWSDYSRHLPVVDTRHNISYKNVYCAWCNNVPIEAMELWTLTTDCAPHFLPTMCGSIFITAPQESRSCIIVDVKSCPNTADEDITDLCHYYYLPIAQNGTVYQNPHCFLCNEPSNLKWLNLSSVGTFCVESALDLPIENVRFSGGVFNLPQYLPFDFYSKASRDVNKTTVRCAFGLTLNASSNKCNPKEEVIISFFEVCPFNFGTVNIFFYFSEQPSGKFDEIALQTAQHFGLNESSVSQRECSSASGNVVCLQLDIYATPTDIEVFFNETDELYQSVSSKLAVQKLFLIHSCPDYDIDTMCEDESVLPLNFDDSDVFRFANMLVVRSREQNRLYYNVTLAASVTSSDEEGRKEIERTLHFCPKPLGSVKLLCPYFILDTDEYSLEISNDEEYIFSDFLANPLLQKHFLVTENDLSHVCALPGKDLGYLFIIYIVISAWSLFFLILAFLTYCIFSFLRNGPGYLTMNFFVALFLSQLILLIGTNQAQNPVVCNVLAIAGHYTWLAAFLWTSVIALNVSHTFGTVMVSHSAKYSRKKLCVIMTSGWGIPALFVGFCIFLRSPVVPFVQFSYGSVDGCWIKPGKVNLIIFGLPALVCLLFNLIMFVWAIGGIRKAMKGSKKVQRNKTSKELLKEEIILYIKVSILMGFCWTWAFLAGFFPDVFAFLVLNTVISPLQGFLVFCIYVCNKRMVSKWRLKMSEVTSSEENTWKMDLFSSNDGKKSKGDRKAERMDYERQKSPDRLAQKM